MQPLQNQIGMNSAVVLIALLLAVPLQLFLTHYINTKYGAVSNTAQSDQSAPASVKKDIQSVRMEALHRLSDGVFDFVDYVQETMQHYSHWSNLKELFMVPYKGRTKHGAQGKVTVNVGGKTKTASVKATVTQNKAPESNHKTSSKTKSLRGTDSKLQKDTSSKQTSNEAKTVEDSAEYFAGSESPRMTHPSHVKFKVGQVMKHKQEGYFGVIVGWDETVKAPKNWLKKYYSNRQGVTEQPHYLLLVDSRFSAASSPFHYLPQEDLLVVEANIKILAPEMSKYFEGFRNHRHVPRPWLQEIYPNDE